ncbi:hypothetical protein [Allomesorhizobium camelthorni]|uniref:Uncharacterized protein n=1 Tax=Allomesorhizobium camelthorni TaxID=475069 RepID=A0A6G4WJD6_9HYPH|nr:hypothetical protein [Mesorhizobium camelthorni]NGO54336.1 hypothetical protein [Mesorhizobium camelthorni]
MASDTVEFELAVEVRMACSLNENSKGGVEQDEAARIAAMDFMQPLR